MKIKELIENLKKYDEDMEVFVSCVDGGVGYAGGDIATVFKSGNTVILRNDLPIPAEFFTDKTNI